MATMYDSTTNVPPGADVVAGYVDGNYRSAGRIFTSYPQARHVTITVLGTAGALVGDVESGDMTPTSGAAWARREHDAGRKPTIYCNSSTIPDVLTALSAVGLSVPQDCGLWEAHYDGDPTLPPGRVAKQYQSDSVNNYDTSSTDGVWPERGIMPEHQPPYVFEPVVADCACPTGGAWMVADDGSVYAVGGAPFYGGPNENQHGENWQGGGRHAADIAAEGTGYTVIDTAGETYHYDHP